MTVRQGLTPSTNLCLPSSQEELWLLPVHSPRRTPQHPPGTEVTHSGGWCYLRSDYSGEVIAGEN
ncbi:hypothetical protein E2C01_010570 [Portunus trituberculatus]|uniref:Uncharacterized protein n=1 Tax=Portunus trituberculatus TaxID=210409 RepID=A0A5B7D946_PORTR|nr:hypothetical protein [Portunus trituberculatus]